MKSTAELLVELDLLEDHLADLDRASRKNLHNRKNLDKQLDQIINDIEAKKREIKEREHDKVQEVMYDTI